MTMMSYIWGRFFGGYYSPTYPIFYMTAPLFTILILSKLAKLVNLINPKLFLLLNGGRKFTAKDVSASKVYR